MIPRLALFTLAGVVAVAGGAGFIAMHPWSDHRDRMRGGDSRSGGGGTFFGEGGINSALTVLESDIFTALIALKTLDLSNNQLTVLESDIFTALIALKTLDLSNNQLTVLESDVYTTLTALKKLYLDSNQLTVLESDIFTTLTALTTLILYDNQLTALESDTFTALTALTSLFLDSNQLTALESDVFTTLTALKTLTLIDNQLTVLESATFTTLTALTTLYLNGNQLTVLESDTFTALTALTSLFLDSNQLTALESDVFTTLTALKTLTLIDNQLTVLENDTFTALTALKKLYLYNNQLTVLESDVFTMLTALTTLSLSNNQLTVLESATFTTLTALTTLYLNGNQLTVLENDTFTALTALTSLFLDSNQLTALESDVFTMLTALKTLSLGDNQLTVLEHDTFTTLTALTSLYLNDNQFTQLPETIFANQTSLTYLDLSKNQLAAITSATFAPFATTIQTLYLASNTISRVDAVLAQMQQQSLITLTMEGNPSRCYVATRTNTNLRGGIVCTCAVGFGSIAIVGGIRSGHGEGGDSDNSGGYLCQAPSLAVIIPPTVATLRSQFVLSGPEEQLAVPSSNTTRLGGIKFYWNGYLIKASDVDVSLHWQSYSRATFSWHWTPDTLFYGNGSQGDIAHPPRSKLSNADIGKDIPRGFVPITYNVNATTAADTSLKSNRTTTNVRLVFSAFHWPARFDDAFQTDADSNNRARAVTVGSGLQVPRTLRIRERTTAAAVASSSIPNTYETLPTTANVSVEANPFIPTAIEFTLADNTCNAKHSADVLKVRRIYSNADESSGARSDRVVGWEVVVGDPNDMAKATDLNSGGTMEPCTAVLQAHDTVTTEVLNITRIEASVQDCWDNSTDPNATNTGYLSCNGHGSCKDDPDLYDGTFLGCTCDPGFVGDRCGVPVVDCADRPHQGFDIQTQGCKTFNFAYDKEYRKGSVPGQKYETLASVKNHAPFIEGDAVWIQGISIDTTLTTVSSGFVENITYKLVGAPSGFFLSSDNTAEIFGYLSMAGTSLAQAEYNVTLFAVDANGVEFLVDNFPVTVQKDKSMQYRQIAFATLGSVICILVGLAALYGYRSRQLRLRAHDFESQLEEMRANGELPDNVAAGK
eukprot:gene16332-20574_t